MASQAEPACPSSAFCPHGSTRRPRQNGDATSRWFNAIAVNTCRHLLCKCTLGGGVFTTLEDGILHYIEVIDGVQHTCEVLAAGAIDGDRLMLRVLDVPGCEADERMANMLFFEIASYSRAED